MDIVPNIVETFVKHNKKFQIVEYQDADDGNSVVCRRKLMVTNDANADANLTTKVEKHRKFHAGEDDEPDLDARNTA